MVINYLHTNTDFLRLLLRSLLWTARYCLGYVQKSKCVFTRSKLVSSPTTPPKYWSEFDRWPLQKVCSSFMGLSALRDN